MSFIQNLCDRLKRLDKKVDILRGTIQDSFSGNGHNCGLLDFIDNLSVEETVKQYKYWKQDLIIKYYDPRR